MAKSSTISVIMVLVLSLATTSVWAAGGKVRGDNAAGMVGYCEALDVGFQIEGLDIEDLEATLSEIEARDVARVFASLLNGSENHLDAFTIRSEVNCQ